MQKLPIKKGQIEKIRKKYNIVFLGIFGSYANKQATKKSDLDLLVKFGEKKSLLSLVKIENELSNLLGIKVDLLTDKALSPYLKNSIKKNMKILYDKQN